MIFTFEDKLSDSPFVERVWRAQSERTGDFLSVAASHWEMVVSRYQNKTYMTVRGPETKATPFCLQSGSARNSSPGQHCFSMRPYSDP